MYGTVGRCRDEPLSSVRSIVTDTTARSLQTLHTKHIARCCGCNQRGLAFATTCGTSPPVSRWTATTTPHCRAPRFRFCRRFRALLRFWLRLRLRRWRDTKQRLDGRYGRAYSRFAHVKLRTLLPDVFQRLAKVVQRVFDVAFHNSFKPKPAILAQRSNGMPNSRMAGYRDRLPYSILKSLLYSAGTSSQFQETSQSLLRPSATPGVESSKVCAAGRCRSSLYHESYCHAS